MTAPAPEIRLRVYEVLTLVELALDDDEIDRAMQWMALALSANDSEAADA
jgi:hypothetical protein